MADEADRTSPESDKLLLDLAWERQQKKVSATCYGVNVCISLQPFIQGKRPRACEGYH